LVVCSGLDDQQQAHLVGLGLVADLHQRAMTAHNYSAQFKSSTHSLQTIDKAYADGTVKVPDRRQQVIETF
jgi:hypothetical protein